MVKNKTVALYHGTESKYFVFHAKKQLYFFECWGAKGFYGGCGAYVSGYIRFKDPIPLYLYPGEEGKKPQVQPTFNGGGSSQQGGGGASDIRILSGKWSDFDSLKSRIMVAGDGGGSDTPTNHGGCGGELEGCPPTNPNDGNGGTQTKGGSGYESGEFGLGGSNSRTGNGGSNDGNGAGGGGYFGGGTSFQKNSYSGGGGSSFISGHYGCNAISVTSKDPKNMIPTNQPIHYSGLQFFQSKMINGESDMPSPTGGQEKGHCSNGAIRIQVIIINTYNELLHHYIRSSLFLFSHLLVLKY